MMLIETMDVPERCWDCSFFSAYTGPLHENQCGAMNGQAVPAYATRMRAPWCPLHEVEPLVETLAPRLGFWKRTGPVEAVMTSQSPLEMKPPEVTPIYVCGHCAGSDHMYGSMYPKRKVICDSCGRINIYPWEKAHEQGSNFWEVDDAHT